MDPTTAPPDAAANPGLIPADPNLVAADPNLAADPSLITTVPPPAHDLSAVALFLQADAIVQAVMILLALASIGCWAVIFDKAVRLARLRREVRQFEDAVRGGAAARPSSDLAAAVLEAGAREAAERAGDETAGEARERCERAMRGVMAARLRTIEPGLPFLATVGSTAPFIGLFGTVWGIMNSFTAIAASHNTSLDVVAPGIAEALFATALGLIAAIPAVVAYNKLTTALGRTAQRTSAVIADLTTQLTRRGGERPAVRDAAE
ncbi:MAG: MotA/TolQ/ExbB proton channel family protein [Dongiaceae bacterium]